MILERQRLAQIVVRKIVVLTSVNACERRDGGSSTPSKSKVLLKVMTMTNVLYKSRIPLVSHQVTIREGTAEFQIRLTQQTTFFSLITSLRVYLCWLMTLSKLE